MEKKLYRKNKKVEIESCFEALEDKANGELIIYEYLINFYLTEIKDKKISNLKKFWKTSNKYMGQYMFKNEQNTDKKRLEDIKKNGDKLSWMIIMETKGFNGREVDTFKIEEIINYMLSLGIKNEEIKSVLRWLVLRLSTCANLEGNY